MKILSAVRGLRAYAVVACVAMLSGSIALAQPATVQPAPQSVPIDQTVTKIPQEQLEALVAPIALYPDPLLAQVLAASTYPLEIVQLKQWMDQNTSLKGEALAQAAQKQDWDPSVQALCVFPDVVKQLAENIKWTTDLGNAFLAQQSDVMSAVQTLRQKATADGKLKSTEQMTVKTENEEGKTVVVIQPANPEVVYVPSYNPVAYWPPYPAYPYPPLYYPPYYPGGALIGFGLGLTIGAIWGGGWGWGCGWGSNNININNNNNFVRNDNNRNNINNGNRGNGNVGNGNRGNNNWSHRPEHRGGAPYGDRQVADKFGGTTRGDSVSNRQSNARQNLGNSQRGGNFGGGASNPGVSNRGNFGGAGGGNFGNSGSSFGGNRGLPSTPSAGNRGAFGGSGMSGGGARASSSRGASSFGGSRGGGGFSGGGRGGGGRGGRR